jgi:ABC-type phosphate transport system substrate-binding protein
MNRRKAGVLAAVVVIIVVVATISAFAMLMSNQNSGLKIPGGGDNGSNNDNNNKSNQTGLMPSLPTGANNGTTRVGEGGSAERPLLNIISSPSAATFVDKWISQYNSEGHLGNAKVSYSGQTDDASISLLYSNYSAFLADHSADIAITGRPVALKGNFTYAGSAFLPVSPQAVAVVYNIPGLPDVPSGLKLDPPTLYAILNANITYWDDPAIKLLNPDINLSHKQITVVHEGQAGSASDLLSRYIESASGRSDGAAAIVWPKSSLVAASAESLSAMVRQTPYSIGYVDFALAFQTRMTYAALQNSDGDFLLPSIDSISASIRNGTIVKSMPVNGTYGNQKLVQPPVISVGHLGNGSYPIVGFYYAAFPNNVINNNIDSDAMNKSSLVGKNKAVIELVRWWVDESKGQQMLKDVQYPSVYENNKALRDFFAQELLGASVNRSIRDDGTTSS